MRPEREGAVRPQGSEPGSASKQPCAASIARIALIGNDACAEVAR